MPKIEWLKEPEEHNYPAALSYLSLLRPHHVAGGLVGALRTESITRFKAKDIFRASGLSLLGVSNSHVQKNLDKIEKGKALSPILLVRDERSNKVIVADGYHRLCAVYRVNENEEIPCKII